MHTAAIILACTYAFASMGAPVGSYQAAQRNSRSLGTIPAVLPPSTAYRDSVVALSPAAYWRLAESSGTNAADEMGAYNGTYAGTPGFGTAGLILQDADKAVTYSGDDSCRSSNGSSITPTTAFSVIAWINCSSTADYRVIYQKGTGGAADNSMELRVDQSTGKVTFVMVKAGLYCLLQTTASKAGARHMVGAIWNSGYASLYIDGVAEKSTTLFFPSAGSCTAYPGIGNRSYRELPFVGVLDDIAVWNRALSHSDMTTLYNKGQGL